MLDRCAYLHLGCAIVTLDKAFLFTDGRYFLQAAKQLDQLAHYFFFVCQECTQYLR
jgi:hypothetical protein